MKKLFAILLAVAVICALSVTALAANDPATITSTANNSNTASVDVKGQYVAAAADIHNYKVVITWGDMEFQYTPAQREWNTSTHEWTDVDTAGWSVIEGKTNTIEVANHSSKAIDATFSWTAEGSNGIIASFLDSNDAALANNKLTVAAPTSAQAPTATAKFMPVGALASSATTLAKIGAITVTITDAA